MGCDIHCYIEYGNRANNAKRIAKNEKPYYSPFGNKINPGRNYAMFGILSKGVRWNCENGFEPKGFPDGLSYSADSDLWLYVTESGSGEDECTMDQALRWSENGRRKTRMSNDKILYVEHPDWHSHSWLTIEEFEEAIRIYKEHPENNDWYRPIAYEAMLASMKVLEDGGENDVRVVFWFDN